MSKSKKIVVIDCETDPFAPGRIPQPFLWGLYDGEEQHFFDTAAQLMDYLKDKNYRVYAHNGGKFDFHYLLEFIPDWKKLTLINGRLAQFSVGDCLFCDSYCILPVPLGAYQKTKIDYAIFEASERDKPKNRDAIRRYLADDCLFLHQLIVAFVQQYGTHLTIASCAIKILQGIENIEITNSGKAFRDTVLPFYHGGRTECFEKGIIEGDIKVYDITSSYPYAMTHRHPIEFHVKQHETKPKIQGHNFYHLRADSAGALPLKNEDGALYFPHGVHDFFATGWEVLAGLETGRLRIIKHHYQLVFPITADFKAYVSYFFEIKNNTVKGSPENIFAKLFLNSAYGKFAANPEKYVDTYLCPRESGAWAMENGFSIHTEMLDKLIVSKPNDESRHRYYNIATGASITGFARAHLFRALQRVERPLYCDTDSIIFTGGHTLSIGNELGAWAHEGNFDIAAIGGKKIYSLKNFSNGKEKNACKGIRLSSEEIFKIAKGATITKTPDVPVYSFKKGKIFFLKKTIAAT
jgi:hypothetical protein